MTTHIPLGDMCIVCVHRDRMCSHLPFNTYPPMAKPDNEGYIVVKCADFEKRP